MNNIEGFIQLIRGLYKSDKPTNITEIDEVLPKCDCIDGSIVNVIQEPVLYSFAFSSPPGHKFFKELKLKLSKKINISDLSHITFYLDNNDHKPVDFNEGTINFACQLTKIKKNKWI